MYLSFLFIYEMKDWAELQGPLELCALGPCSKAFCLRKCSQSEGLITNSSLSVVAKIIKYFVLGIIAICAHVLVSVMTLESTVHSSLESFSWHLMAVLVIVEYHLCHEDLYALFRIVMTYNTVMQAHGSIADSFGFPLAGRGFQKMEKLELLVI